MHGEDPAIVFVDEFWALSLAQKGIIQQGYKPAWSVHSGQEWKLSTAGRRGRSGWLEHDRERGREAVRAGRRQGIAFFEWSVSETARELDDLDELLRLVMVHHPRTGYGLREPFLRDQLEDMGRGEFLRAFGNLDDLEGGGESLVSRPLFDRGAAQSLAPVGPVALGVAADPDRQEGAVCAAWRLEDGRSVVQVVDRRTAVRWMPGRAAGIVESWPDVVAVGVGSRGPDRDVADELGTVGERVVSVNAADDAAAAARLLTGMSEDPPAVLHDGAVRSDLWDALKAADLPRGQGWKRRPGEPAVSVLPAASRALWALDHQPDEDEPSFSWAAY